MDQVPSGMGQKQEQLPQARIEIRTRDVKGTQIWGVLNDYFYSDTKGAPQHLFIIHVDSNGKETLIRGGPGKGGVVVGDVEIIKVPYEEIDGRRPIDFARNAPRVVIFEGSNVEVQALVDGIWSIAEGINREGYDYKWDKQNCNTAVKTLVEGVGLALKLPKHHDGSNIYVPGIDAVFEHTEIDQILGRAGEFVEWYVKEFKATPKVAHEVFIAYLKSRGIEFREQKYDSKG